MKHFACMQIFHGHEPRAEESQDHPHTESRFNSFRSSFRPYRPAEHMGGRA